MKVQHRALDFVKVSGYVSDEKIAQDLLDRPRIVLLEDDSRHAQLIIAQILDKRGEGRSGPP